MPHVFTVIALLAFVAPAVAAGAAVHVSPANYSDFEGTHLLLTYATRAQLPNVQPVLDAVAGELGRAFTVGWTHLDEINEDELAGVPLPHTIFIPSASPKVGHAPSTLGRFVFNGNLLAPDMTAWVADALAGKITPEPVSQDIQLDLDADMISVSHKTFAEAVKQLTEETDLVFLVYNPGCGHCLEALPGVQAVARAFRENNLPVKFAQLDASANEIPPELEVDGLPSVFLFVAGGGVSPKSFPSNEELTEANLWKFLRSVSTFRAELPDRASKAQHAQDILKALRQGLEMAEDGLSVLVKENEALKRENARLSEQVATLERQGCHAPDDKATCSSSK